MLKQLLLLLATFLLIIGSINAQNRSVADARGFIVKVGDMAPDFTIKFTDNRKPIKLSDLRGSVVMLQFTASWCGVCKREMPHIENEIWQKYKNKGLKLFGVDLREKKNRILKFKKETKVGYPLVFDEKGDIFQLYADKNAGVTRNVLIDRNGKIIFLTRLYDKKEFSKLVKKIGENLAN